MRFKLRIRIGGSSGSTCSEGIDKTQFTRCDTFRPMVGIIDGNIPISAFQVGKNRDGKWQGGIE